MYMRFLVKTILFCLPMAGLAQVQQKAIVLKRFIEKSHFAPRPVNDSFSTAVYEKMLEQLDYYKIYFTAVQIKSLEKYRYSIDDELNGKPGNFCEALTTAYHNAQEKGEQTGKSLLQMPFSFSANETFQYGKETPYAKDEAALNNRWQHYLGWRILNGIYSQWEILKADSAAALLPEITGSWFKQEEETVRKQILKRVEQRLSQHTKGGLAETQAMIEQMYLGAIANCFDPHTDYFDSKAKDEFSTSLSTEILQYGFSFDETDEGSYVISSLAPGGAAWNSGNIYTGDKILQVKTKSGKVLKAEETNYIELSGLFRDQGKEEIEFTLRSADGNTRQVKLQKQAVQNEENIVRGYVLEGEKKIGYIALPSFYTSWDDQRGSGCANDLSKEIIKLKREKIEGLILDLRYNGGGSVQESIEIAGIFIEAGPMGIIKETGSNSSTLKDPSRGSIYDGPLMVLINGQSASASELVAATLQDYQRAIILGSPSFGKATMQVMLPLDTTLLGKDGLLPDKLSMQKNYVDYAKVTVGKLYRINGSTNQLNGVVPDIDLPDAFESLSYTERSLPYALLADTTTQKVEYRPVANPVKKELLPALRKEVMETPYFTALKQWVDEMKNRSSKNIVPLEWKHYVSYEQSTTPPGLNESSVTAKTKSFTINNSSFTKRLLELENAYQQEMNTILLEGLGNDPYIDVAYKVLCKTF
jgi:carboxyl-terminal processing protease